MKIVAENCKWNTELLNEVLDDGLFKTLKAFACKYNHCFQPRYDEWDKKYAIVYYEEGLRIVDYIGADVYSQIWFDDFAVARLAIELYKDDLIGYFKHKNQPKHYLSNQVFEMYKNATYICSVCGEIIFPEVELDGENINITTTKCENRGGLGNKVIQKDICESCRQKMIK